MATTKFLSFACLKNETNYEYYSSKPHYPSMPKYPKGISVLTNKDKKAVFSVNGMSCSACAGSVEKAIKRLSGIKEAVVDVLNNKAQVVFYPSFVNVSITIFFTFQFFIQGYFFFWIIVSSESACILSTWVLQFFLLSNSWF